jgi:hypothetical protein
MYIKYAVQFREQRDRQIYHQKGISLYAGIIEIGRSHSEDGQNDRHDIED